MREAKIDIFNEILLSKVNAICFTSNGVVRRDGKLTMGAGIAKTFRDSFMGLDVIAGDFVKKNGNVCQVLAEYPIKTNNRTWFNLSVVAFPTKNHWKDDSDIDLIIRSARRLQEIVEENKWSYVALPRPGCNNGRLRWTMVRSKIENILDNRIIIVYK